MSGTTSTTRQPDEGRVLLLHRSYPDPPADVWAALTTSERLARWCGTYTGEGGAGGSVVFTWTGEVDAGGEVAPPVTVPVLECDPPRRLVVDVPSDGTASWRVELDLQPEATGTLLTFRQELAPGMTGDDVEAGWAWYLDKLRAAMAGTPMPAWEDYAPTPPDV